MYVTACPLHDPSSISDHVGVFQGNFPWRITYAAACLVHRARRAKGYRTTAEVVVEPSVAPLEKSLPSHDDHEMPTTDKT